MSDAYVSALPASALGAMGGALLLVGLSLVLGAAITIVALAAGELVQRVLVLPRSVPPEPSALTFSRIFS